MKKKASTYADILESHKAQLKADGNTESDIENLKRKKNFGHVKKSITKKYT